LKKEIEFEIGQAISNSERIPPPPVETLFEDVFKEMPAALKSSLHDIAPE
jgi:TPP-dependent pyruvate/acetoin dehydrogenase alpha subunit